MGYNDKNLGVYLNDHLAGSVAALELLDALSRVEGLNAFAAQMRTAISADRDELELLMRRLSITIGTAKRAVSWLTERAAEWKIALESIGAEPLKRLELLEALALGVDGKQTLWRTLGAITTLDSTLAVLDYRRLEQRAVEQRRDIEAQRLKAAEEALSR